MAGTRSGGLKAAANNKALYGDDFYKRIGRSGGKNGHTGGFAADRELASRAGTIGGQNSQRGPSKRSEVSVLTSEDTIPNRFSKFSGIRKFFDR